MAGETNTHRTALRAMDAAQKNRWSEDTQEQMLDNLIPNFHESDLSIPPQQDATPALGHHVTLPQTEFNSLKDRITRLEHNYLTFLTHHTLSHGFKPSIPVGSGLVPLPDTQQATGSGTSTTPASEGLVDAEKFPFRAYDAGALDPTFSFRNGSTALNIDDMNAFFDFDLDSTQLPLDMGLDSGMDFHHIEQHTAIQSSSAVPYFDMQMDLPQMEEHTASPVITDGRPLDFGQYSDLELDFPSIQLQKATDFMFAAPGDNIGTDFHYVEQHTATPSSLPGSSGLDIVTMGMGQMNSTASALDTAIVVTTQPKSRYRCHTCSKSFGRAADRDRHARKHNPNATRYACPHHGCNESFVRKDKLKDHQKNKKH